MQEIAENSPQAKKTAQLQTTINNSFQSGHIAQLQEIAPKSPTTFVPVIQRNGDKLSEVAGEIAAGTRDVRDETLGLSEQQIELVEAMILQLRLLEELELQVAEIERQQEAALPPVIPLDSFIEFQPQFNQLAAQLGNPELRGQIQGRIDSFGRSRLTHSAVAALTQRLGSGLRPASQLIGVALSGDDKVANVVSVNVIPPSKGVPGAAGRRAEFATKNRAGGAIPIAIEQAGDDGTIDQAIISQRAQDSAVFVIDPATLSPADIAKAQASSDGGGGETGLDSVPYGAIIAVLAPANMLVPEAIVTRYHIHFVGSISEPIYYAGTKSEIPIAHPDFRTALEQIFSQNPHKTLLTHTTRLGPPRPVRK